MVRRAGFWSAVSLLLAAYACSPSKGEEGAPTFSGGSGGSAGSGKGGRSGASGTGGAGGLIGVDATSTGGSGAAPIDDACAATSAKGEAITAPADIIWAIDQSGSMNQETAYVQSQINNFANLIGASMIDYRVVVIAGTTGENPICVPPPLSGGGCANGPRFRLVDTHVDSHNALDLVISEYAKYADFLRPDAMKHFVVVTDDNATDPPINSPQAFTSALAGLQPAGMFAKWKFHSIFAYGNVFLFACNRPFGMGALNGYGVVYEQLVQQTGGAKGVICEGDWQPVFNAISQAVITGAKVSCEYVIPQNPDGGTLDPNKVNVDYLPQGNPPAQAVYRVNGPNECTGGGQGGWYFDNNAAPTRILLCPETCRAVQSDAKAQIDVKFGCQSIFKPPT